MPFDAHGDSGIFQTTTAFFKRIARATVLLLFLTCWHHLPLRWCGMRQLWARSVHRLRVTPVRCTVYEYDNSSTLSHHRLFRSDRAPADGAPGLCIYLLSATAVAVYEKGELEQLGTAAPPERVRKRRWSSLAPPAAMPLAWTGKQGCVCQCEPGLLLTLSQHTPKEIVNNLRCSKNIA
jgi:hypothetical protein